MATRIVSKNTCNIKLLQEILVKFWKKPIIVTKAITEPATIKGNNFISNAWKIRFQYIEEEKEEVIYFDSVIIKTKLEDEEMNEFMHASIAFANEIYAYEKVIPALEEYLPSPLRVPSYLHGDESNVVLEDMNKRAFHNARRKIAVDWNQVWSPIQEMAKLHAASLVMERLDRAKFDELVKGIIRVSSTESTPLGDKQAKVLDTIISTLEKNESLEADSYKTAVKSMKNGLWKEQDEIINREVPIKVINHGNIWTNNLLYKGNMISLLDWQHIVYSSPATDLSYFLYVNFDTDFLSNKRRQLIEFYLLHLHQSIYDISTNRLNASEINTLLSPLTYDWMDSELKRCSLYGFIMAQWITPIFYCSEASLSKVAEVGGFEKLSLEERLKNMSPGEKDRIFKLTEEYVNESKYH